ASRTEGFEKTSFPPPVPHSGPASRTEGFEKTSFPPPVPHSGPASRTEGFEKTSFPPPVPHSGPASRTEGFEKSSFPPPLDQWSTVLCDPTDFFSGLEPSPRSTTTHYNLFYLPVLPALLF
ncbi:MAG: hypothetical protein J6D53_01475, partial [Blautia sp.]|nr:hypothetical protein [Blautia sp.]